MKDASILAWVKPKKPKNKPRKVRLYRFRVAFPEGIMTPNGPRGPFREGDMVDEGIMPHEVWQVLMSRGMVEVYTMGT